MEARHVIMQVSEGYMNEVWHARDGIVRVGACVIVPLEEACGYAIASVARWQGWTAIYISGPAE
jgi:S-adenosylmethionine:tRNA-ribosyltransferase-isomerase (queuine synthetase)